MAESKDKKNAGKVFTWIPPDIAKYVNHEEFVGNIIPGYQMPDKDGEFGIYLPKAKEYDGYGSKKIFSGEKEGYVLLLSKPGEHFALVEKQDGEWKPALSENGNQYKVDLTAVRHLTEELSKNVSQESSSSKDYQNKVFTWFPPNTADYIKTKTLEGNILPGYMVPGKDSLFGIYMPKAKDDDYGSKKMFSGKKKDYVLLISKPNEQFGLMEFREGKWEPYKSKDGEQFTVDLTEVRRLTKELTEGLCVPSQIVEPLTIGDEKGFALRDYMVTTPAGFKEELIPFVPLCDTKTGLYEEKGKTMSIDKAIEEGKDVEMGISSYQYHNGKYKGPLRIIYKKDSRIRLYRQADENRFNSMRLKVDSEPCQVLSPEKLKDYIREHTKGKTNSNENSNENSNTK